MTKSSLSPRQARSRESEKKLIEATVAVLRQFGLEGTNIPRVAECAGLTPGAIYRRFADKNALMERVMLGVLESQIEQLQQMLTPKLASKSTLAALVEQLVGIMLMSYRHNSTLINAFRQFMRNSDHQAFKRKVSELENRTLEHFVGILMTQHEHIRHPDPKPALRLALAALTGALLALIIDSRGTQRWQGLIPDDDDWLVRELTRMVLSYVDAA